MTEQQTPSLESRFTGTLLGLAVADGLGANFEGHAPERIAKRYRTADELIDNPPPGELWYTDDTQMMIGVAETLIERGEIDEPTLCRRFAENYLPQRGYGRGARVIIEAIQLGHDYRSLAASYFPGGSFGNGAAMRVAPVGLMFRDDPERLWQQAGVSAMPTHTHPLGIEGAQVLALAVGLASQADTLDRDVFLNTLADHCVSLEYGGPLRRASDVHRAVDIGQFGNGIEANSSVVTAIASFAFTPDSYGATIANAIMLGGDTDTIAAMAGAISGAYLGVEAIPRHLLDALEDRRQGRTYIAELATKLYEVYQSQCKVN
ncbi:ADP-ribosylglycohydrolase family protein [Aeoliella mucimassa]|uniref:ADP-ribosyl-[dinitrogen reductase] glycohydrolase n=1 Tax=Aeoliella mucimassa TaxID=2527972 RepID=A0A518APW2_9BACT|nr:ADP-ribosylglycohydrolase family protein [Aeoliella mucimassa]QDU56764.1 ADP-ribosyl-[dinitrogen reductase] glycohydrolase [Aeoliella mucimassa]